MMQRMVLAFDSGLGDTRPRPLMSCLSMLSRSLLWNCRTRLLLTSILGRQVTPLRAIDPNGAITGHDRGCSINQAPGLGHNSAVGRGAIAISLLVPIPPLHGEPDSSIAWCCAMVWYGCSNVVLRILKVLRNGRFVIEMAAMPLPVSTVLCDCELSD